MTNADNRTEHWHEVHTTKQFDDVSWWQNEDAVWDDLILDLNLDRSARIIDVGAGASLMCDVLARHGFRNLTALDITPEPLDRIRRRLSETTNIDTVVADITVLGSIGDFDVWHDRAVFHFLVDSADQAAYKRAVTANTHPGSYIIISTFADDGPEQCSGLPVQRYSPEQLADAFADVGSVIRQERRIHATPWQTEQPFSLVVIERTAT